MTKKLKKKIEAKIWNKSLAKNEYTQRRLTFGQFAGKMIKEVPLSYIKWGILNFEDGAWAEMFARELQRRDPKYR